MEKSIKENNFSSWRELLTLPYKLLKVPPKENGKGKNSGKSLVRLIKDNCSQKNVEVNIKTPSSKQIHRETTGKENTKRNMIRIIESKLAAFDIKGAVNIISSSDLLGEFHHLSL